MADLPPEVAALMTAMRDQIPAGAIRHFIIDDSGYGRATMMHLVWGPLPPGAFDQAAYLGWPLLWEQLGNGVAYKSGRYDGSRPFKHMGYDAADLYFTLPSVPFEPGLTMFRLQRYIVRKEGLVSMACSLFVDAGQAAADGYTSRSNPSTDAYCRPFLDSLAFKR
jgi:hypothetical protein